MRLKRQCKLKESKKEIIDEYFDINVITNYNNSSEKHILHKSIEKLSLEIQEVRDRQEELRAAKQVRYIATYHNNLSQ